MSRRRVRVAAIAALLVAWHGLLLSLPHTHHGERCKIDVARCSATQPGSSAFHLHGVVRELPHALCLACLVASTVAALGPCDHMLGSSVRAALRLDAPYRYEQGAPVPLPRLRAPPTPH
jgi:hypothetical protein